MATTTTNFSWPIPQSTDLVKDGATAIASLGSGIDTSMAELKGGTTGQILSKSSNTDMDFTWTTPNPGDITGVTAGTGLTGGGTSGDVTVNFDVANYGGGQYSAGKNKIINGDFGIWQRGTSISLTNSTATYTADRWVIYSAFTAGTSSFSQQTFTPATAPVAGYEGTYFGRLTCGSTSTYAEIAQRVEDVRVFAGQTMTVSMWLKASTNTSVSINYEQNFGSGGSASVYGSGATWSVTTSWQRFTATFSVASISGKTIGTNSYLRIYHSFTPASSQTLDTWGVQLEAGSTATPFQTATGTKQGELAACQRYYVRWGGDNVYERVALGIGASTTQAKFIVNQPVAMRVPPTAIDYSNISVYDTATITACSSVTINAAGKLTTEIQGTVASGLTAFRPYQIMTNGSTNYYLGLSAEL